MTKSKLIESIHKLLEKASERDLKVLLQIVKSMIE